MPPHTPPPNCPRQVVTLERPLPYPIAPRLNRVAFHTRAASATESGVEGLTLRFKWEPYAGHHLVSSAARGRARGRPGPSSLVKPLALPLPLVF